MIGRVAPLPTTAMRWALWGWTGLVLLYLVLPILVVLPMSLSSERYLEFPPPGLSLRWYQELLSSVEWTSAIANSFKVALPVALLSVLLGTPAAYALVRRRFRGKRLVNTLLVAPMVVPHVILAIGLYAVFADLRVVGTALAVVLGHVIVAAPLVVITVSSTLQGLDPALERAALSLGAPPLQVFWRVVLPLISPAIVASAVFSFTTSFDELMLALFLSGVETRTLPRQMWEQLQFQLTPTIAAASVLVLVVTFALIGTADAVRRARRLLGRSVLPVIEARR